MKRFSLALIALICLLALAPAAFAKDTWTSVRSKNFYLVGNASEKDMRRVAANLEQFRQVLTSILPKVNLRSAIPTTVVVFKDDNSFKPFKPGSGIAGYFQPGQDVNYIALTSQERAESPFAVIFHEYVHFMVKNNLQNVPLWFNEGLAEYYSTFDMTGDDSKAIIGKPISNHVYYLRQEKFLPLQTLFAVDHSSPLYNESGKRGIFYAEAWALIHYLQQGDKGAHREQLSNFLGALSSGTPVEQAFQKAFQMEFSALEKQLKNYIQRDTYAGTIYTFNHKVDPNTEMQAAPLTEADAQFYQGDLLLHEHQLDRAEKYLQTALSLNPDLEIANAALGMLNVRKGKFVEAKQYLQRAAAGNSKNYLVHYYYAAALNEESLGPGRMISSFAPEVAATMRAELKKTIELAPDFADAYRLLAFVNLVSGTELDESIALLKRALQLLPGEQEFSFMLAEIYMRKEDMKSARQLLEPIARSSAEPELKAHAEQLLNSINSYEEQLARFKAANSAAEIESSSGNSNGPPRLQRRSNESASKEAERASLGDPFENLRDVLRKPQAGEERVRGKFSRVNCTPKGAILEFKVGDRLLRLGTAAFAQILFTSYDTNVKDAEITCGQRQPENEVVVTYRPSKDAKAKIDGEIIAVEFVPKDFQLKP